MEFAQEVAERRPDQLVVFVDSGDVVYGGCDEEELIAAYKATVAASEGASVVFGAEFTQPELLCHWIHNNTEERELCNAQKYKYRAPWVDARVDAVLAAHGLPND